MEMDGGLTQLGRLVFHIRKENNKKDGMDDERRRLDEEKERKP